MRDLVKVTTEGGTLINRARRASSLFMEVVNLTITISLVKRLVNNSVANLDVKKVTVLLKWFGMLTTRFEACIINFLFFD